MGCDPLRTGKCGVDGSWRYSHKNPQPPILNSENQGKDRLRQAAEQPKPVPNERGSIQRMVRRDLLLREKLGKARYGTVLQAHNGRDALRDAYEEALDLACYLKQLMVERDG
jgi:hypothetical protein